MQTITTRVTVHLDFRPGPGERHHRVAGVRRDRTREVTVEAESAIVEKRPGQEHYDVLVRGRKVREDGSLSAIQFDAHMQVGLPHTGGTPHAPSWLTTIVRTLDPRA